MTPELDWLKRWALYSPNAVALHDGAEEKDLTYSQLFSLTKNLAWVLHEEGVGDRSRVALLAANRIESFALFFACARLGATLVPINTRLTNREIEHIVQDSQPTLLLREDAFSQLLKRANESKNEWSDFRSSLETAAFIMYTSGTTGAPKGAILSHRMLLWNSHNTTLRLNLTQQDSAVIFLPLFHTGGWNVLSLPFLHRGAKIVLTQKFQADEVLRLSDKHACTLLFGVPTTLQMMADSPVYENTKLSQVRYAIVGGEPMPLPLIDRWHKKGISIRQGYGLTEFGPNVFSLNENDALSHRGSIGFPNFDVQVRVVNGDGKDCAEGEIGELWLRGPMAFSGYWNNPVATAEAFVGDWVRTGDLVRFDHDGYFFVVGRKKEMFISGGENVYPAEIERALLEHPSVHECAVIGVPDPKWGEVGAAFVVRKSETLTVQTADNFLKERLARFKIPKHIHFIEQLPKTESGKIKKSALHGCAPRSSPTLSFTSNESST